MQAEIVILTKESEYIAFSTAIREVLSVRELIVELKTSLDIPEVGLKIRCKIFEDNKGALELAKLHICLGLNI